MKINVAPAWRFIRRLYVRARLYSLRKNSLGRQATALSLAGICLSGGRPGIYPRHNPSRMSGPLGPEVCSSGLLLVYRAFFRSLSSPRGASRLDTTKKTALALPSAHCLLQIISFIGCTITIELPYQREPGAPRILKKPRRPFRKAEQVRRGRLKKRP